jgi:hypothetical protein
MVFYVNPYPHTPIPLPHAVYGADSPLEDMGVIEPILHLALLISFIVGFSST